MKINAKKVLSVLVSTILISTMFPISAVAFEDAHTTKTTEEEQTIASSAFNEEEINRNNSSIIDISNIDISNIVNATPLSEPNEEELPLLDELDDEKEILHNRGQRSNADEEYSINEDSLAQRKENSTLRSSSIPSTMANTDPNSAIYLPESYFGQVLSDIADANAHWYCFEVAGNNKVTIAFSQQPYGDYDLRLYKLNGTTLNMVDFSQNEGTSEKISYMAGQGAYYLQVVPYKPTTQSYYFNFMVNVSSKYDKYEPNDFVDKATTFTNSISANIDNSYDEDWYQFAVNTPFSADITLSGAPAGKHYAVKLYDGSFNLQGSFLVDSSTTRSVDLAVGNYYVLVYSYTGTFTNTNYTLSVRDPFPSYSLLSGHIVQIQGDKLFINGVEAEINGQYMKHIYLTYGVSETIRNFGELKFWGGNIGDPPSPEAYRHTYFTDGVGTKTSTVVGLVIENGYYQAVNGREGFWSHYFDTDPNRPLLSQSTIVSNILIMVDLDTGKVVDNNHSMHYSTHLYSYTWVRPVRYR